MKLDKFEAYIDSDRSRILTRGQFKGFHLAVVFVAAIL
jgi:hypothetical protein